MASFHSHSTENTALGGKMALNSLKHRRFRSLFQSSPLLQQFHALFSSQASSSSSSFSEPTLTQQEITKINLLIPRLCLSNNLTTAIHLTTASLLTNPPIKSLSLSILIHSLTSQPDMTESMSLLTILRQTPRTHPHLTHISTSLIASYMRKKRPKEALKVYHWMLRPGSPCKVEKVVYGVLLNGFCECGLVFEGLKVLRDMVNVGFLTGDRLRNRVYKSLLREARVREAVELNGTLEGCFVEENKVENLKKLDTLLISIIQNWTD